MLAHQRCVRNHALQIDVYLLTYFAVNTIVMMVVAGSVVRCQSKFVLVWCNGYL